VAGADARDTTTGGEHPPLADRRPDGFPDRDDRALAILLLGILAAICGWTSASLLAELGVIAFV
jgi:hypothetical protein